MYTCSKCNYETLIKSNYTKHLKTNKHIMNSTNVCDKCEKSYKTRQSLWKHKQGCLPQMQVNIQNIQNIQHIQTFNLNIFLNETCKDALNINEFVDSLKVQEGDIIETGQIGFVNGISKIFIRGLEELELHKRPIHCSDIKRETIYIKDQDLWENDHKILNRAINTLTIKNTSKILDWQKKNPEWLHEKNDQYLNIVSNNFGDDALQCKIIRRLAKKTVIQKL